MGKLHAAQVNEYFAKHLPYRTGIMLAHYKMTHDQHGRNRAWTVDRGPVSWLQACFEASIISGRLYLNMLGVSAKRDGSALIAITKRDRDDVDVEDLGGKRLHPIALPPDEQALFLAFIVMANKAVAHLTMPGNHDTNKAHPAILRIHHYLKVNLYDHAGRTGLETWR